MAELKFRLNLDEEDVELVLDGKVVDTVGKAVLQSWVAALNEKNKTVEEPVAPKEVNVVEAVEESSAEDVDTPTEPVVQ